MEHKHDSHDSHSHGHHPLVPLRTYVMTLLALLVLTVLTVGASYVDFGGHWNAVVNVGIATVKATLVLLFFMGLKYDNNLNRAFILSSFVAIVLLIAVGASDLWTRPKPQPVAVKKAASSLTLADLPALEKGSPELVAKGKESFNVNCAVCHGAGGNGDGAGGAALNPKPRNFHAPGGTWTNGNTAKSIYVTLANGIPGTGMASYKSLSPEERWALTHYVLSFAPSAEHVGKADGKFDVAVKDDLSEGGPKATLPIDFAIDRLVK